MNEKNIQIVYRRFRLILVLGLLILASIPQTVTITAQMDYTGDATQIQAFIDIEANVSDDDGNWRIARSNIDMFRQSEFRLNLFAESASNEQEFGRIDENNIQPSDLVDLSDEIVDKDFDESADSVNYNHTISGRNATDVPLHIVLFDVLSSNTGETSTVSAGFSNTTSGTVYASRTFYNETIKSTQISAYIRIDDYAIDTTVGSFDQYYARSINTTNLEYSQMLVFADDDVFLSSNDFDQDLDGIEFDADAALGGNVTGDSKDSRIVRALIRVPDRLFGPRELGYSEIGGFRNLDDTLKDALGVASDEDYNLTKLDLDIVLPKDLVAKIQETWTSSINEFGDNEQGWQASLNRLRSEWIRSLGIARFDEVPLDSMFTHDRITGAFSGMYDKAKDYYDLGKSAAASIVTQAKSEDTSFTTRLMSYWDGTKSWVGEKKDQAFGWISRKWESGKQWFRGVSDTAGFFNNLKEWFQDNALIIILIIVVIASLAAIWLMRRRSARVGNAEVSL